jgi:hypothetical protein
MEMKAQGVTYSRHASGHAYGLPSPIPPSLSPSSLDAAGAKTEAEARHSTLPPLRNAESRCVSRFPLDEWVALPFHSPLRDERLTLLPAFRFRASAVTPESRVYVPINDAHLHPHPYPHHDSPSTPLSAVLILECACVCGAQSRFCFRR